MTTLSPTHRPAPFIAAAAALAALAAGAVAVSVSHGADHPSAPGPQSQTSVQQHVPRDQQLLPTTSGGHVMLGE